MDSWIKSEDSGPQGTDFIIFIEFGHCYSYFLPVLPLISIIFIIPFFPGVPGSHWSHITASPGAIVKCFFGTRGCRSTARQWLFLGGKQLGNLREWETSTILLLGSSHISLVWGFQDLGTARFFNSCLVLNSCSNWIRTRCFVLDRVLFQRTLLNFCWRWVYLQQMGQVPDPKKDVLHCYTINDDQLIYKIIKYVIVLFSYPLGIRYRPRHHHPWLSLFLSLIPGWHRRFSAACCSSLAGV